MTLQFARIVIGFALAAAAMPLAGKGGMMSPSTDTDVSRLADGIIASNRALRVASEGCSGNAVVAAYGQSLKGPLAWIIRHPILFDAEVLPFNKQTIKAALVECAGQRSLSEEERAALGDLHYYLSYFIDGMRERESQPGIDFFAQQHAEGLVLRSEWRSAIGARSQIKLSKLLVSWLKSNA